MSRLFVGLAMLGSAVLFVCSWGNAASAQTPKEKIAALEQQLKTAQAEVNQASKAVAALKQEVSQLQSANNKLQADLKKTSSADDKSLKAVQATLDGYRNAGLVHMVVVKLKSDSPSTEAQALIDDVYGILAKVKAVRGVWAGKPSAKGTPDVPPQDYAVAFVVLFDNSAGLKQYLDDPAHKKFLDKHSANWETPTVYDFEPKKSPMP